MSTEIATWNMIRSKIPSFPSPTAGRGNECLTKAEIQSLGGEDLSIEGNYGNNECVILEHVVKVTWEYTFNVQPVSLSFASIGDTKLVTVTSYKEKKINDVPTGVRVNVGFTSSSSHSWISSAGTSVTVQENTVTSKRSGTVTFVQYESGKPGYVSCNQAEGIISYDYSIECSGYSSNDRYINIHSYSVDIRASGHNNEQVMTQLREYTKINGRIIAERILPVTNITINNIYDRPSFLSFNAGSSSIIVTLIGNPGEYGSWIMDVTFYTSKGKIDSALDIYYDI